jgi:hypothetical protein
LWLVHFPANFIEFNHILKNNQSKIQVYFDVLPQNALQDWELWRFCEARLSKINQ